MFSVGDLVVHPMHGAGIIDGIVREKITGVAQDYYVFKMPMGGLLLKIPVSNSEAIGIRSIITQPEAEALLNAIPDMAVENTANWNKRYRENMARLKSGRPLRGGSGGQGADAPGTPAGTVHRRTKNAAQCPPDPDLRDRHGGAGRI